MSVIHSGSSIVFDPATLQNNDDEEEMLQEELNHQQELRELLSAELSDDLLDDEYDHSSVNDSHQSPLHNASNDKTKQGPASPTGQPWNNDNHESAPSTGHQPHNRYNVAAPDGYGATQLGYNHDYNNHQQQYYDPSYDAATSQPQQWANHGNRNIYHTNGNGAMMQYHPHEQAPITQEPVVHHDRDEFTYRPTDQRQVEGREDFGEMVDGNRAARTQQHFIQFNQHHKNVSVVSSTSESFLSQQSSKTSFRKSYPLQKGHHRGNEKQFWANQQIPHDPLNLTTDDKCKQENGNGRNLHDEINQACGDPRLDTSGRQMTQLQILYKARGKRIDELTRELGDLTADSARQNRMMSHQLAIAKDERAGMGSSLEKSQQLVSEKDREISNLKGKLDAQSVEVEALKSAKDELVSKIQVSERTIESLHEQLTQLSNMDTMERAREQHNAVLSATKQRHEMQVLELTTQLDECRQQLEDKNEEFGKVQADFNKVSRDAEQTMLEKTETINRLTKSLEEAQKQCQGLLTGSNENAQAKHQVNDLLTERKCNEEEIAYLRMQVSDFEEHLKLYENALQLGAGGLHSRHVRGGTMSDSIGELVGGQDLARKLDWRTPPPPQAKELTSGSEDELIDGLRQELQRALKCNRAKRDEITKLKAQCSYLEEESSHWRTRADDAQTQLKLNHTVVPSLNAKDTEMEENLLRIGDLEEQINTANEEVERLEASCADVKQRMADMIHEHDVDKQKSVERCERALMQLHEDAKRALRDEIVSEYEQKMYEMSVEYDAKIREISGEMEQLQQELYDVKQSYVHVCAEKDSIQSSVQEELTTEFEKEKEIIVSEHQRAIDKLEKMLEDLEKDMVDKIKEQKENHLFELNEQIEKLTKQLRQEWEKENESEFCQKLETQIALAKVKWFEDFTESKQVAIQEAVKAEGDRWASSIQDMKQTWEDDKKLEIEENLNILKMRMEEEKVEEIEKIREQFQIDKDSSMKTVRCVAELNKNLQNADHQQEIENILKAAKEIWKRESDDALRNAEGMWKAEQDCMVNAAVEESKRESQKEFEIELEKQNAIMEKAVLEMKKVCDAERHNALKHKCLEMENEIKKLQEQHKLDYEKFVDDHRKTLTSFLEREKTRSRPKIVSRDASSQVENSENVGMENWIVEKRGLEMQKKDEISQMHIHFNDQFGALRKEIQDLTLAKHNITMKLERSESQNQITMETAMLERVKETSRLEMENQRLKSECDSMNVRMAEMKEKHKADTDKLKVRIRDEYKKWKTERSLLIDKLKQLPSNQQSTETFSTIATPQESAACKFCKETKDRLLQTKDEAMRKAVSEMSDIYAETLKTIKGEMTAYITEVRARTKETISKDRQHTVARIRLHYTKVIGKKSEEDRKKFPQSFQRLNVYESDSDTGSLAPTKSDPPVSTECKLQDAISASTLTKSHVEGNLYSVRQPKDIILDRFLGDNEFHQYPTKLVSSPAKLSPRKPPRKVDFRDNQLCSTSSMQPLVPSYQTTQNTKFPNYQQARDINPTEPMLFNPVRVSDYGKGVLSPARTRSEDYVSDVAGYQRARTNIPSYRGVT